MNNDTLILGMVEAMQNLINQSINETVDRKVDEKVKEAMDNLLTKKKSLTRKEVAAELGLSTSKIGKMVINGELKKSKYGHAARFDRAEVLALKESYNGRKKKRP